MSVQLSPRDFLLQTDWRSEIIERLGTEAWFLAYDDFNSDQENGGIYCALIPNQRVHISLSDPSWDLHKEDGLPGCTVHSEGEWEKTSYYRFGNNTGIEPLVIFRTFHGIYNDLFELSEEYRHFHDLYYDQGNRQYIKIFNDGNEEVIARLYDHKMELRLREVQQFLAIKEMHIAIFFDVVRYSEIDPAEIGEDGNQLNLQEGLTRYSFHASPWRFSRNPKHRSFSRLLGKKLIPPFPKEQSGIWPYQEREKEYENFIIGMDENGNHVTYTCNQEKLANYFGANQGAPHYLTPVFFRRAILSKYYNNHEKFSVEDGYLRCVGLWGLRMDNNRTDYVIVYLGDLGTHLPPSEQLYWRSFNVLPDGGVSEVNFRRSILGQFTNPQSPDLLFKHLFVILHRRWKKHFGWELFLPLSKKDLHLYIALRIPLTNDQGEFDNQILALTKILIDSLNEKQLKTELGGAKTNEKGISKFGRFLEQRGLPDHENYTGFLRDLQDLRSTGVAHRKGKNYNQVSARFGIGDKDFKKVFEDILLQAIELIRALTSLLPQEKE